MNSTDQLPPAFKKAILKDLDKIDEGKIKNEKDLEHLNTMCEAIEGKIEFYFVINDFLTIKLNVRG